MPDAQTLQGNGFTLRPFALRDLPSLAFNINDEDISAQTTIPFPFPVEHCQLWLERVITHQMDCKLSNTLPQEVHFAVDIDGEISGSVALTKILPHKAEIGYWLAKPHWNNGIMSKAIALVTAYGIEKLGLTRIYAPVFTTNIASRKALEKSGYTLEATMHKNFKKNDKLYDEWMLAYVSLSK